MRFGFWLPGFGGWLRNVEDEGMEASWRYVSRLARRSEEIGFDLTLIAELMLNDIKGPEAPSLDAWTTSATAGSVSTWSPPGGPPKRGSTACRSTSTTAATPARPSGSPW